MKLQLFILARGIFKLSTSKSYSGKGSTQVAKVQISPENGNRKILGVGIPIMGSSILGS